VKGLQPLGAVSAAIGPKKSEKLRSRSVSHSIYVPGAGIEPALPKELDFESSASTSSATRALSKPQNYSFIAISQTKSEKPRFVCNVSLDVKAIIVALQPFLR
jgi:hypothetical protein